jgi:hypothetical protein
LDAGSHVGGVAHGEHFLTRATAHSTNDGQSRVQTEAYGDAHSILWLQMAIQRPQRIDNGQAGVHCPEGGVFVGLWPAKVEQQPIPEILRHVAVEGLYRGDRRLLVGAYHGPVVFGFELAGQPGGVDEIAEQHGHLPPFGFRGDGWGSIWDCYRCEGRSLTVCSRGSHSEHVESGGLSRGCCESKQHTTSPDEHGAVLVYRQPVHVDDFRLYVSEVRVIEVEPPLEGLILYTSLQHEQANDLCEHLIEAHT